MTKINIKIKTFMMLICLSSFVLLLNSCGNDEEKAIVRPVKTVTVGEQKNTIMREFPGKVIPSTEADLAFQVPGIVNELPVQEGMIVKKGQLIARLDQRKYHDAVEETKAKYDQTKADYHRAAQLVEKNYISRSDYDKKKYSYKVAEANYSTAKHDLKDTYIYAPFDSIIAKRYVENFENVKAKQKIVNIHDYEHMDVEFYVPENVIIHARQESDPNVHVIFSSAPKKEYKASFKKFESRADEETQTYRVILTLPSPKNITVLPGMTTTVKVELPDYKSGEKTFFEIPASAVFADEHDQSFVWKVNPDTMQVKKTPVEISRLSTSDVRVLKGVQPGDIIVTAGVHHLEDKEKVRFLEKQKWEE